MSATAEYNGIRIGMRHGGVAMLCPDATVFYRAPDKEQNTLNDIALAMLQYTPEVALCPEHSLVMDVTASLKLFRGPRSLCQLVRDNIHALGFTVQLAMAPTAFGAWLLARSISAHPASASHASGQPAPARHRLRRVLSMGSLAKRLDVLPCSLMPAVRAHRDWLDGIGCATLGDLRRLPQAGLQRRSGKDVIASLGRAYGHAPELHEWIKAPPEFSGRLELPSRIEHAEGLIFAARRLLLQLTGWLVARQLAVSRFVLVLEHERGRCAVAPTEVEIVLAEAAWQEAHLLLLMKERLERLTLKSHVIALRLTAQEMVPMLPPTASLFPEPGGTPADFNRLLDRLTARLGNQAVLIPAPLEDHRPEVCNEWMPAAASASSRRTISGAASLPQCCERPFWMLAQPIDLLMRDHRPFYGSPLKLVSGPERIECGWWDGSLAVRDYFIAQGAEGTEYWLFRERVGQEWRWFLHGLFA